MFVDAIDSHGEYTHQQLAIVLAIDVVPQRLVEQRALQPRLLRRLVERGVAQRWAGIHVAVGDAPRPVLAPDDQDLDPRIDEAKWNRRRLPLEWRLPKGHRRI